MAKITYTSIILFLLPFYLTSQNLSASELLDQSIQYHDPKGKWASKKHVLDLKETRPSGTDRQTTITIDLPNSFFELDQQRDRNQILRQVNGEDCTHKLNGSQEIEQKDIEALYLNCERTRRMQNYYTYLWGLPMKLKDPGTIIADKVQETKFMDQDCYAIKVNYAPEVGKDVWYFYFDKTSSALIGYRFYHDESKNDGEYITLEGEAKINGMRLPQTRTWYVNKDGKLLGADILVK